MNTMTFACPAILQQQQLHDQEEFLQLLAELPQQAITVLSAAPVQQQWLKLLLCSDFARRQFRQHKLPAAQQWLAGDYARSLRNNELADRLGDILQAVSNETQLLQVLRDFRNQQMLRLAFRDINGLADLDEIMRELSDLADCCIRQALCWLDKLQQRDFGMALDAQGQPMPLIVIAMGKLGAQELNFSSDIDLIFSFAEHGDTLNGPRSISHNEYFIKLGQRLIKALDQKTADGFVFRVDLRLRPFGQSGPLVVTYHALEDYYARHGREWERYALIKARVISGNDTDKKYLRALLTPFVYRRYIDFSVFASLREMKAMIAREVKQKNRQANVKLGAGGIREIEFLAQAFQLLRGGQDSHLRQRQVQKVLSYLADQGVLAAPVVAGLLRSYIFLRTTEHRLQQLDDQQTHNLPDSDFARARIAFGMGYNDWTDFSRALESVRDEVHQQFELLFHEPETQTDSRAEVYGQMQSIWLAVVNATVNEPQAAALWTELGYQQGTAVMHLLAAFRDSHHYRKISREGSERLDKLMPLLLQAVAETEHSETTFRRVLAVIESICRRSVYLVLLIENPQALAQLVKLCAGSSWVARLLSQSPALFDELLDSRVLYTPLKKQALCSELEDKLNTLGADDLEQRMELMRHFKQSQMLRVAAADIAGILPVAKVSDYLTWLAEVILAFVLDTAWHDLLCRYGRPQAKQQQLPDRGFALLGFGKLGGIELGYSSDLDMVFVYGDVFQGGMTTGGSQPPLDNLQFYSKLSLRIMHILQTRTHSGILYEADMRLRPNGHSGLITTNLQAFRQYQLQQAWTWEHQALVRARFIIGDAQLQPQFIGIRHEVLLQSRDSEQLKKEIRDMRGKMRHSLSRKKPGYFDLKQAAGGIVDIEFIVQFLVLNHAHTYPQLLDWTDNQRILQTLGETALLEASVVSDLLSAYYLFRDRLHQLSLQEVASLVPLEEFKSERQKIQHHWHEIME